MPIRLLRATALAACATWLSPASAAPPTSAALPLEVQHALELAQLPQASIVAWVQEVGAARPRLAWQPDQPMNPASLMKLVTTSAALDLLGPTWTWTTPVWLQGRVADGALEGNLVIKGSGDPKLTQERLWMMLRRVQQLGVREIRGDIVLDRSAFMVPEQSPADFDSEPRRPYNVRPDALLLNYKSTLITFTPDPLRQVAAIGAEPPLPDLQIDTSVPLTDGPCDDWRGSLRPDLSQPGRITFGGGMPAACGEKQWAVADADPATHAARLLRAMWLELGGTLGGSVHEGEAPRARPSFELSSPPLAEVVRDINKFSNNVMAQQLFLTLGAVQRGSGSPQAARAVLRQWLADRFGNLADGAVIDNGSGLSRETRISARLLARLLQAAWAGPWMAELVSSLPISGLDGTLRTARTAVGRAHLKTGSLRDVQGIAGEVQTDSGRRYIVVAIVNHPNSSEARPALEALVAWVSALGGPADR